MNITDFINGNVRYDQKRGQGLYFVTPDGAEVLIAVFATFPVVLKMPEFQADNEGYYKARRFQDGVGEWVAEAINEKLQRETETGPVKSIEDVFAEFTSGIADINPGAKKWILEAMKEYRKQGRYYSPDEIREIQEQAYAEGSNATFDGGLI